MDNFGVHTKYDAIKEFVEGNDEPLCKYQVKGVQRRVKNLKMM
jgi:hypothetical protein